MPYTPPSQQSPASSKHSTPNISRNSSYSQDIHNLSPPHNRPHLPRSLSSATYLNKHRRSPSASAVVFPPEQTSYKFTGTRDAESVLYNRSLRQSPPPRADMPVPPGAIISPPDSSENSDGDDSQAARVGRKREVENTWNELQQAVRSMSIKRESSPSKSDSIPLITASEPVTQVTSPSKLTPEARKIVHSRSATEIALPQLTTSSTEQTSCSDDSDDEHVHGKPPLVRKKSGELVKPALRPSSRRRYSSMPGTPTYSKSVHFNDDGNQTRHFLQVDKPSAVSAGSSPVETYESESEFPIDKKSKSVEWEIRLANFPSPGDDSRKTKPIWVERIFLSSDNKSLVGQVAVANISFQKYVVARFTLDYWKTTSEVSAEFSDDVRSPSSIDGYDRFSFNIRLADQANLETKTLLLCMRYNVAGQEHWDNNNDLNYQIDFIKKTPTRAPQSTYNNNPLGARPLNAIPRSRHSPPASRGRPRAPSIDDDMTSQLDHSYRFGSADDLLGDDTQASIKLKPKSKRGNLFNSPNQASQGLGGRYDFGASLSAALSSAQDKLGNKSGLMPHKIPQSSSPQGYFPREPASSPPKAHPAERPELLTVDRPAMGSAQYQDLVSKFCYFTPSGTKLSPQPQLKKSASMIDGSVEYNEYFSNGSKSPSPEHSMSPQLNGSGGGSPYTSRATSPKRSQSARNLSPVKFATFAYEHEPFLTNSTTTAIQG